MASRPRVSARQTKRRAVVPGCFAQGSGKPRKSENPEPRGPPARPQAASLCQSSGEDPELWRWALALPGGSSSRLGDGRTKDLGAGLKAMGSGYEGPAAAGEKIPSPAGAESPNLPQPQAPTGCGAETDVCGFRSPLAPFSPRGKCHGPVSGALSVEQRAGGPGRSLLRPWRRPHRKSGAPRPRPARRVSGKPTSGSQLSGRGSSAPRKKPAVASAPAGPNGRRAVRAYNRPVESRDGSRKCRAGP